MLSAILILCTINILIAIIASKASYRINRIEALIVIIASWVLLGLSYWLIITIRLHDNMFVNDNVIALRYEQPWVSKHTCCKAYATRCTGSSKNRSCHSYCSVYGTCYDKEGDISFYTLSDGEEYQCSNARRQTLQDMYFLPGQDVKGRRPSYARGSKLDTIYQIKPNTIAPHTTTVAFKNYPAASENIIHYTGKHAPEPIKHPASTLEGNFHHNKANNINIDNTELAILNASLNTNANIIVQGFENGTASDCQNLKAQWLNGKPNDLVLCLAYNNNTITHAHVFGWTENETLKANIQNLLINTKVSQFFYKADELRDLIDAEYTDPDLTKYNYMTLRTTAADIIILILVALFANILGYTIACNNDYNDDDHYRHYCT